MGTALSGYFFTALLTGWYWLFKKFQLYAILQGCILKYAKRISAAFLKSGPKVWMIFHLFPFIFYISFINYFYVFKALNTVPRYF